MPASFADDTTARIKQSISIVDLIGEDVTLTRRGRTFKGLCPFHDDHNPSFDVDPERQSYRCWSCGEKGDIFSYLMTREGMGFREALEVLAQKAGIVLPARHSAGADSPKNILYDVLRWAENEFQRCLLDSPLAEPARRYVTQRRLNAESIQRFRLGFAPNDWEWLLARARARGYDAELLEKCGLAKRRPSGGTGHYDAFRGRLMFPIRDARGRTVAFGGRILPDFESEAQPKYLNSPETAVFSKGEQLFGLDAAREAISDARSAVVVEGYTDCIMAHQHGVRHVVGTLGTALGERHVRELKRYTERIVLVFDGDEPGQKAADRALGLFLGHELDLRVFSPPRGLDPCDFLLERGGEEFRAGVAAARDALEFKFERAEALLEAGSIDGRRRALDAVLETIAAIPVVAMGSIPLKREMILDRVAHRYGVASDLVRKRVSELRGAASRRRVAAVATGPARPSAASRNERPEERELLEIVLADPARLHEVAEAIAPVDIQAPDLRRIFETAVAMLRGDGASDLDGLRLRLDDRELACRATQLAETGREKTAPVERRLADLLARFHAPRAAAEAMEIRRGWSAVAGSDDGEIALLARKQAAVLARHRKNPRTDAGGGPVARGAPPENVAS